jgi:hypothetical protein
LRRFNSAGSGRRFSRIDMVARKDLLHGVTLAEFCKRMINSPGKS